jgi:hypothetical protein
MAIPSLQLIAAIRNTAKRLNKSQAYQWGHMGQCNCGHLAQEITQLSDAEIHKIAMNKSGDWADQLRDYCPNSGLPMDTIIEKLTDYGLSTQDLINLERLNDSKIRKRIPNGEQLNHNSKRDVIAYLNAWADLLEDEFLKTASTQVIPIDSNKNVVAQPIG